MQHSYFNLTNPYKIPEGGLIVQGLTVLYSMSQYMRVNGTK